MRVSKTVFTGSVEKQNITDKNMHTVNIWNEDRPLHCKYTMMIASNTINILDNTI